MKKDGKRYRKLFLGLLRKKLDPENHSSDEDDENLVGFVNIVEPGEIRKEYEIEARKYDEEKRKQRKRGSKQFNQGIEVIQ